MARTEITKEQFPSSSLSLTTTNSIHRRMVHLMAVRYSCIALCARPVKGKASKSVSVSTGYTLAVSENVNWGLPESSASLYYLSSIPETVGESCRAGVLPTATRQTMMRLQTFSLPFCYGPPVGQLRYEQLCHMHTLGEWMDRMYKMG